MSDRKRLIFIIIALFFIIASITALVVVFNNAFKEVSAVDDLPAITSATATPEVTVSSHTTTQETSPTATTGQTLENFDIEIVNISGSGLTQEVTARLTNKSGLDTHNTRVRIQVYSGDSIVKINGSEYIEVYLGTVKAGQSVENTTSITLGISDGIKVSSKGAIFYLTVYSDEKTETMRYDYIP